MSGLLDPCKEQAFALKKNARTSGARFGFVAVSNSKAVAANLKLCPLIVISLFGRSQFFSQIALLHISINCCEPVSRVKMRPLAELFEIFQDSRFVLAIPPSRMSPFADYEGVR